MQTVPSLKQVARRALRRNGIRLPGFLLKEGEAHARKTAAARPGRVVLDLGAHIGAASIEFSHHAERVYAFEPHPEIFEELRRNVRAYPNIVPLRQAANDADGMAELFFETPKKHKSFFEGSTLVGNKTNLSYAHKFTVETVDLARVIRDLDTPVGIVKMDVEGLEYRLINALLDGGVMERVDIVHVEDHCDRIPGLSDERDRTLARLEKLGYLDKFDFEWP
ncbi:MAG: FkbM family methyltransferase [Pseudomonadota bacterium]